MSEAVSSMTSTAYSRPYVPQMLREYFVVCWNVKLAQPIHKVLGSSPVNLLPVVVDQSLVLSGAQCPREGVDMALHLLGQHWV
jgi:hypothetical protein